MKRIAGIAVFFLAGLVGPLRAEIGDTLDQFVAKYGPAKKDGAETRMPGHDQYVFDNGGFVVECIVGADQRCVMEVIHRRGPKISDEDIAGLLKVEGPGHGWALNKKTNRWVRGDYKIEAYRQPGHDDFFFIVAVPGKTNDAHDGSADLAALSGLPPAMSWQGMVVHPSRVIAASTERVVFMTSENREVTVPVGTIPENVAKRFETEIAAMQKKDTDAASKERMKNLGGAGIFGRVLRKTPNGVLLKCEAPGDQTKFATADGGDPVPKGRIELAAEPGTEVLVRNLPNEASLVDNDSVSVVGYVQGVWQYPGGQGIIKTVRVYTAIPPRK